MMDSKMIRRMMVLAFLAAMTVGFVGCDSMEEAGDEMDDDFGQIQQIEQPGQVGYSLV